MTGMFKVHCLCNHCQVPHSWVLQFSVSMSLSTGVSCMLLPWCWHVTSGFLGHVFQLYSMFPVLFCYWPLPSFQTSSLPALFVFSQQLDRLPRSDWVHLCVVSHSVSRVFIKYVCCLSSVPICLSTLLSGIPGFGVLRVFFLDFVCLCPLNLFALSDCSPTSQTYFGK